MKIRIKGNSVRFRLTRSELNLLAEKMEIIEKTLFPSGQNFSYGIKAHEGTSIQADFVDQGIWISIPKDKLLHWSKSEQVGYEENYGGLKILLEKDFKCMTEREGEDESDHYPNPLAEKFNS